eukprot:c7119_g1_i1.p1 GENE.c7119_g1_i1~~c7119_g1_i1.p1  ORF type:complete len:623 (+),score=147.69 c7119_g1_i1:48-1871(+)
MVLGIPFPHMPLPGILKIFFTNRRVQLGLFGSLATIGVLWVRFPRVAPPIIRSTLLSVRSPVVRNILVFSLICSMLARRAVRGRWRSRTFFPVFLLLSWTLFYQSKVVETPVVRFKRTFWNVHICERAQLSKKKFKPVPWGFTRHAQTITCFIVSQLEWLWQPALKFDREEITAHDGNTLYIDWAYLGEEETKYSHASIPRVMSTQNLHHSNDTPIIVAVHGLGDDRSHPYIRRLVRSAAGCGWRVAVHSYWRMDFTDSRDLARVIDHVASRNPLAPVIAIGYSAGGHHLLKYLQDAGKQTSLVAAMVVSACFDFVQAVHDVEENENVTYRLFLDKQTRICAWRHLNNDQSLQQERHKYEQVIYETGNHCLQLYDRFVYNLPTHSYTNHPKSEDYTFMKQTRDHYLHPASKGMDKIQVTTLVLSALDDPIVHVRNIHWSKFLENTNVIVMRTKRGGHVGWYEGILPFGDTLIERTFVDFTSAVLDSHSHTNFLVQVMHNTIASDFLLLKDDQQQNNHNHNRNHDDDDDDNIVHCSNNSNNMCHNNSNNSFGAGMGNMSAFRANSRRASRILRPSSIARICAESSAMAHSSSAERLHAMDVTVVRSFN